MFYSGLNWICLVCFLSQRNFGYASYCDYKKHEFYLRQGDICKKCDRCPPGSGVDPLEKIEVDAQHGALECKRCVLCPEGYFSKSWSYRECYSCRNCTIKGKLLLSKCSSTVNTKCGRAIPINELSTTTKTELAKNDEPVTNKTSVNVTEIVCILTVVTCVTLIAIAVIGMLFIKYMKNEKRNSFAGSNSNFEKTPCIDGV